MKILLVGDSTVASGGGWGDALAALFGSQAEVLNVGRGGRSSKSYRAEGFWNTALQARPDWVLFGFGHNDQTGKGAERETDAQTSFRDNLTRFVQEARTLGATPVLVTSVTRRNFNARGLIESARLEPFMEGQMGRVVPDLLSDYAAATRIVAAQQEVPLLDLNARSTAQMNAMGAQAALVFDATTGDKTHLSPYGAIQTAALVADEIRENVPALARLLQPVADSQTSPEMMSNSPAFQPS